MSVAFHIQHFDLSSSPSCLKYDDLLLIQVCLDSDLSLNDFVKVCICRSDGWATGKISYSFLKNHIHEVALWRFSSYFTYTFIIKNFLSVFAVVLLLFVRHIGNHRLMRAFLYYFLICFPHFKLVKAHPPSSFPSFLTNFLKIWNFLWRGIGEGLSNALLVHQDTQVIVGYFGCKEIVFRGLTDQC